jgi:accessory gene regulator B
MEKVNDRLIMILLSRANLEPREKEVYAYGLRAFEMFFLVFVSWIVLGLVLGEVVFTLCFFLTFAPIRIISGGLHVNNRIGCFLLSNLVFVGMLLANHHVDLSYFAVKLLFLTMSFLIVEWRCFYEDRKENGKNQKMIKMMIFAILSVLVYFLKEQQSPDVSNGILFGWVLAALSILLLRKSY